MFEYNPAGLFLGILPVIVILYNILNYKTKSFIYYLYIFLLTFTFIGGSISLITGIPYDFIKSFVEFSIWVLFVFSIVSRKTFTFPAVYIFFLFLLIIIFSSIYTEMNFSPTLLFIRRYLFLPISFYAILNTKFDDKDALNLLRLIILLSASQIFVSVQKFITIGQQEDYIGSLAIYGGSLTTIFALICVCFSFSYFLTQRNLSSILLTFGFIFFAIVGEKRGFVVYIPIVILYCYFLNSKFKLKSFSFNPLKIIFGIGIFISFFYVFIRFQPSLNPDAEIGGNFDYDYLIDFGNRFVSTDNIETVDDSFSRLLVFFQVYNLINFSSFDFNPWLGFGPGDLIMSRFSEFYGIYLSEEDLMHNKYGIGYGGRSGVIFTFLQIGFFGTLVYLLFIREIFQRWKKLLLINLFSKYYYLYLGLCTTAIVFIIDFFTYSRSFQDKISIFIPLFILSRALEIISEKKSK